MPYATSGNIHIYYEVHGVDGPALVFAHGAGGNATSWWQQVPAFVSDYRVVVFDHRGFARSICPVDAQNPRFFEGDLMAVMDATGINKATVVCQSMGGWTGMRAAVYHSERVQAVFLANTPGAVRTQKLFG
uniref:Alpha/beta hydrolase fold n=1 Tax=Candidatus Kentrum sp. TUN TaxID=2126343 RepID=A0A451A208_9GAMM|nr:MAG: alpha/beta hydrolase fold [Candidatus Kentron sp. TUN]